MRKMFDNNKQKLLIIIALIFISIFSSFFLFRCNLYKGVDTDYHMSRVIGIANSWKQGVFPAYIHYDSSGFGYAMGFFYSNLFMIIPAILYLFGMKIVTIYKLLIISFSCFSTISMYLCAKRITNSRYAAFISTILYTMSGYKIITLYAKAFIGEMMSFVFIPIILAGLYEILYKENNNWFLFAIGFIGVLNSNLVMTEIMILVSIFFVLMRIRNVIKNKNIIINLLKATLLSLALTAIFWLPLLEQLICGKYMLSSLSSIYKPTNWLLDIKKVFLGFIQYEDNMAAAYGLGIIYLILILLKVFVKNKNINMKFCNSCIIIGLFLILGMTNIFPYNILGNLGELIQFPSRFEIPVTALLSISGGIICNYILLNKHKTRYIVIICILLYQSIFYYIATIKCEKALIKFYGDRLEVISNKFSYDICDGLYLPVGSHYKDTKGDYILDVIEQGPVTSKKITKKGLEAKISFKAKNQDNYIELPMYYYYGYKAKSLNDNSLYKVSLGTRGIVRVTLKEKQKDEIIVYYEHTIIQKLAIIISIITFIFICIYLIKFKKFSRCSDVKIEDYDILELRKKKNKYCLCIPILNEGERIIKELESASTEKLQDKIDFILLDSGSDDSSVSMKNLKKYKINTIITMQKKKKYTQSEALKAGFYFALKRGYMGIITIDGNNKDNIVDILKVVDKLDEGYDYIQGSRYIDGGEAINTPIIRELAIKLIHAPIISLTSGKKYTDTTNLLRGYSNRYLSNNKVKPFREIFKSYQLSIYLSTKADKLGLKTCEVPVTRMYPSKRKFSTKVGIKGNIILLISLFDNMLGLYDYKDK